MGASGSGKSTLLRIISNILDNSKNQSLDGTVSIFGKTPKEYIALGKLSFMFQEASLMPNLNVRENIAFPHKLRGAIIDSSFIDELLNIVGLFEHQNKFPSELSGGMKTRVSLVRAFVTKPEVLLLDEPFSALDISWRYELYLYVKKISKIHDTTVILVTHNIEEALILGDKIYNIELKYIEEVKRENLDILTFENIGTLIQMNSTIGLKLKRDLLLNNRSANLEDTLSELHNDLNRT